MRLNKIIKGSFGLTGLAVLGALMTSNPNHLPPVKLKKSEKYAVLVRGDDEYRHKINTPVAYNVLLEKGFNRDNIYVLTPTGSDENGYKVQGKATSNNVKYLF